MGQVWAIRTSSVVCGGKVGAASGDGDGGKGISWGSGLELSLVVVWGAIGGCDVVVTENMVVGSDAVAGGDGGEDDMYRNDLERTSLSGDPV
jgi:hypothetical protein